LQNNPLQRMTILTWGTNPREIFPTGLHPLSPEFHRGLNRLSCPAGSMSAETLTGAMMMNREQEQELSLMYLQLLLRTPNAHLVQMRELQELLEAINAQHEPGLNPNAARAECHVQAVTGAWAGKSVFPLPRPHPSPAFPETGTGRDFRAAAAAAGCCASPRAAVPPQPKSCRP